MNNPENIDRKNKSKTNPILEDVEKTEKIEPTKPIIQLPEVSLSGKIPAKKEIITTVAPSEKARFTRAINECKAEAKQIIDQITESHKKILELNKESEELKQKIDSSLKDIEEKSKTINEKGAEISKLNSEIFESSEEKESTENKIKNAAEEINKSLESIQTKKRKFDEYYIKIFGSKDENGNEINGLEQEIEKNKKELDILQGQEKEKFKNLFDKIEGLLPGATSTGLANAFADQKKRYRVPTTVWSLVFVITMISLAIFGIFTWKDIKDSGVINLTLVASKILGRTPFFIATIWLGFFASKQQSQNKRLEQEYAHKESVSRSYEGFKRQINDLEQTEENKELSLKLLENIVNSVGYNPSATLDNESHREEPPLLDKALSFIVGGKKKVASIIQEKINHD